MSPEAGRRERVPAVKLAWASRSKLPPFVTSSARSANVDGRSRRCSSISGPTHGAVLDVSEHTSQFLARLLHTERLRRETRQGTRALGEDKQAVLVPRWFLDDAHLVNLARATGIAISTAYAYP